MAGIDKLTRGLQVSMIQAKWQLLQDDVTMQPPHVTEDRTEPEKFRPVGINQSEQNKTQRNNKQETTT